MDIAVIGRLLQPFASLDSMRLRDISTYIDLLLKWNARVNLTAVRDPEQIVTRHFGESFFAASIIQDRAAPRSVIDLGSGAGFPGIPVAMFMPDAKVTLIEANQKKSTFLKEVIFALQLKNVQVFGGRAEGYSGNGDAVTARAVEKFDETLPVAIGLAVPGGLVAAMIGTSQVGRAKALGKTVEWDEPVSIPQSLERIVLLGIKKVTVERE
ncbi:MAG TPA: 16S rRNA (guanine(527)-N(7))-methyltransferase RsmG [Candidatus Angelobacter sp.]|nr:16S rRNA (guanine(527)-N(7))-methyltransferase RsmG [Candidatus Angelobacter sp.]